MRFYIVSLSIYSVAITILAVMLMLQNKDLKTRGAGGPPPVDYDTRHDIDTQDIPWMGTEAASVSVIQFNDFECPFCAKGSDVIRQLMAAYPTQVKVGFKNLPLPFHNNARAAAGAALAAYRQGKFWEMEQKLFENQERLSPELYSELAAELGLDLDGFDSLKDPENWTDYLETQRQEAEKAGVTGTPTFFVNGIKVSGASYADLKEVVDFALAQK